MADDQAADGTAEGSSLILSDEPENVPVDSVAEPAQEEVEEARLAFVPPAEASGGLTEQPIPTAAANGLGPSFEGQQDLAAAGSTAVREQTRRSTSPSARGRSEERGRSPLRSRSQSKSLSQSRSRSRSSDGKKRKSGSRSSSSRERRGKRRRRSYSASSSRSTSRSRSYDRHRHRRQSSRDRGYRDRDYRDRDYRERESYGSRSGQGGGGYGGGGGSYNRASQPWRQGDWGCSSCRSHNFASRNACYQCGASKPMAAGGYNGRPSGGGYGGGSYSGGMRSSMGGGGPPGGAGTPQNFKPGDWMCPGCRTHNFASRGNCFRCQAPKA